MTETTPPKRRPTIRDVAAHARVSTASASLVLRKAPGVSDETRQRVEQAMVELGYRPMASARGMRGKTFTLGVLVSDIQNPFFGMLLDGVATAVDGTGYEPLVGPAGLTRDTQSRMLEAMRDRQMDGLVLIAPHLREEDLDEVARQIPTVAVGRHGPAELFDTVAGDDARGSQLIVDHFVELGHRRITYVTHSGPDPDDERRPEQVRERGYVEAMRAHGLEEFIDVVPAEWSLEGGRRAGAVLRSRDEPPTAVHAGADIAAFGLMTELWTEPGRRPALVGYDNTPTAALPTVGLSSVDQSGFEMGRRAAELLLERLDGRTDAQHVVTTPELVVRASSRPERD
ncbi:MAG: LacI family DNA-binding transcriptional regulator [Microbacterium sp.]|nr:LacI family DNA-binding transcriptional regulator [Microbacterium sp.]